MSEKTQLIYENEIMLDKASTVNPDEKAALTQQPLKSSNKFDFIKESIVKIHTHPFSVHIPMGIIPVSVIFVIVSYSIQSPVLAAAALCNMACVAIIMPLVILSGFLVWKKKYKGNLTNNIITKVILGAAILVISIFLTVWSLIEPDIIYFSQLGSYAFLLIHLLILAAVCITGFLGTKLVYDKD